MKIHCLQHVAYEGPACIPEWAAANGHSWVTTRLDLKEDFPTLGEFDILVVLGGPMSVYREDRWPWMSEERRLIRRAIDGGKVVLGICLGAQLIAAELGGSVEANDETEIGWFDITLTAAADQSIIGGVLPEKLAAFHWHGDRYDPPPGAVRLAYSEACNEQAFQYGDRVLGLQFHLEATPGWVDTLARRDHEQLVEAPYIQSRQQMLLPVENFARANEFMQHILDCLVDVAIGTTHDPEQEYRAWT
jgi:GMP synthase (glutamine-hydrolysing)